MAVGDSRLLIFSDVQPGKPHYQLIVDYRDLAEHTYSTSMTIDLANRAFYDTRLFDGARTHHGDAIYPQAGLRDASGKAQAIEERTVGAVRVLLGRKSG